MIRHNNINAEFAAIADFIGGGNTVVNSDYEVHPARMQLVDCTAGSCHSLLPDATEYDSLHLHRLNENNQRAWRLNKYRQHRNLRKCRFFRRSQVQHVSFERPCPYREEETDHENLQRKGEEIFRFVPE